MESARMHPMTPELTEWMFKLLMGGVSEIPEAQNPFLYKVIEKRVQVVFSYTLSPDLIVFLMMLAQSPGTAIMYLWYLQYQSKKTRQTHFTLQNFCEIFPVGFPSSKDMQKIWDAQKTPMIAGSDNLVDNVAAGESLFTEDELKARAKKTISDAKEEAEANPSPSMSQES